MALPFFYVQNLGEKSLVLDEDTSRHVVLVLRKDKGEKLLLTDGRGQRAEAAITEAHRKQCRVTITSTIQEEKKPHAGIGISLVKNTSRFEWFLEKATELGVSEIIPMVCERTEKEKFRYERMKNILISAMLQSQQCWLPLLHEPEPFSTVVPTCDAASRFIAHCMHHEKNPLASCLPAASPVLILVGPEGDFTEGELQLARDHQFQPVSLGNTRLRTETAGMVAAALLRAGNGS